MLLRGFVTCVHVVVVCTTTVATTSAFGQTNNPINGSAPIAHWSLVLEDVVQIPGDARVEFLTGNSTTGLAYVVKQDGNIYTFDPTSISPSATLLVNLNTAVGNLFNGSEAGVRGLAFHPDFDNSLSPGHRKMYVSLSRTGTSTPVGNPAPKVYGSPGGTSHYSVVGEFELNANGSVNTASYRELIRVNQLASNHNSGHIEFNPIASPASPDYGKLYISIGDGGNGGGPFDLSQNLQQAQGKILRIDPIATATQPYTVPSDNPFVGQANVVEEVWASGFRNPHKFAWDPSTGVMYISDIGQGVIEEISVGHSGGNYGWNDREGTFVYVNGSSVSTLPTGHASDTYTYPVAQYDHNGSNGVSGSSAIVSGPVYRGDNVPELTGLYLFAEFATNPGPIFAVDVDDLVERDDFTNVTSLNSGRLSPYVEVEIRDGGVDKDYRQFLRDANNNQSISRTDARWGVGPDGEVYLLNKRDGMIRRIADVVGLAAGDADRDGDVDGADLARWAASYGESGDWSDGNFDASTGGVDGRDFLTWQRNFSGTMPLSTVPEPASLGWIGLLTGFASSLGRLFHRR